MELKVLVGHAPSKNCQLVLVGELEDDEIPFFAHDGQVHHLPEEARQLIEFLRLYSHPRDCFYLHITTLLCAVCVDTALIVQHNTFLKPLVQHYISTV